MSIKEAIEAIVNQRRDLSEEEASSALREVFSGEVPPAQLAAFLVVLRMKGETVEEITGMARVMREHSLKVEVEGQLLDTCGTGGAGPGTFNVSTAAAFVAAGAGARVAKHGNRGMTSGSGSADVLEALGAKIDLAPEKVGQCIQQVGVGFMFAQVFHPAMKHAAPVRRELGVRTVFNVLGPLTNPANASSQLLGVAQADLAPKMADTLRRLGVQHALVVHGYGGLDEVSLSGPTTVHEVTPEGIREYTVSPEDAGLPVAPPEAIRGGTPEQNAALISSLLTGERGPYRDIVALNAGAALVAADVARDLKSGVAMAQDAIDSGSARERLEQFVELTRSFG